MDPVCSGNHGVCNLQLTCMLIELRLGFGIKES